MIVLYSQTVRSMSIYRKVFLYLASMIYTMYMWVCPTCNRIFEKAHQPHSCHIVPLEKHFKNKEKAKELFDILLNNVNKQIGLCRIISLPCCIHLFGTYDFLAALPKKDGLEIRFTLNRQLRGSTVIQCVPISAHLFKNCLLVSDSKDINEELLLLLTESYHLKNR